MKEEGEWDTAQYACIRQARADVHMRGYAHRRVTCSAQEREGVVGKPRQCVQQPERERTPDTVVACAQAQQPPKGKHCRAHVDQRRGHLVTVTTHLTQECPRQGLPRG